MDLASLSPEYEQLITGAEFLGCVLSDPDHATSEPEVNLDSGSCGILGALLGLQYHHFSLTEDTDFFSTPASRDDVLDLLVKSGRSRTYLLGLSEGWGSIQTLRSISSDLYTVGHKHGLLLWQHHQFITSPKEDKYVPCSDCWPLEPTA